MKKILGTIAIILTIVAAVCAILGTVHYFFAKKEKRISEGFAKKEDAVAVIEEE